MHILYTHGKRMSPKGRVLSSQSQPWLTTEVANPHTASSFLCPGAKCVTMVVNKSNLLNPTWRLDEGQCWINGGNLSESCFKGYQSKQEVSVTVFLDSWWKCYRHLLCPAWYYLWKTDLSAQKQYCVWALSCKKTPFLFLKKIYIKSHCVCDEGDSCPRGYCMQDWSWSQTPGRP